MEPGKKPLLQKALSAALAAALALGMCPTAAFAAAGDAARGVAATVAETAASQAIENAADDSSTSIVEGAESADSSEDAEVVACASEDGDSSDGLLAVGLSIASESAALATASTDDGDSETPDYDVWMASSLVSGLDGSGDGLYPMFTGFQDPVYRELGGYLLEEEALVSVSAAWSVYLNSEYRNQFLNEQKYIYMVLLMDYLMYDADSEATSSEILSNETKFATKIYGVIAKDISTNTYDYISDMTISEAAAFCEKVPYIKGMGTAISNLQDLATNTKDFVEAVTGYAALQQVKDERIALIEAARDACASMGSPNEDFIEACDLVVDVLESVDLAGVYTMGQSADYCWNTGLDLAWGLLVDANPALKGIDLAASGLDVLFDFTDSASCNLKLALLYTMDCYMCLGLQGASSAYLSATGDADAAAAFTTCFRAYLQFQMYGNDYAQGWLEQYLEGGALSGFVNAVFYRENIDTANELLSIAQSQADNRQRILDLMDVYASIYESLYGDSTWRDYLSTEVAVKGVGFASDSVSLAGPSSSYIVYASVEPSNATNRNVTYASSDASVIEVPPNGGLATINGTGTATITATTEDGGYTATQTVTVGEGGALGTTASGQCGDSVYWALFDDGMLYVYGEGEMWGYSSSSPSPWYGYRGQITSATIGDGVTSIGASAFQGCTSLSNVTLSSTITSLGCDVFRGCKALTSIRIPASLAEAVSVNGRGPFAGSGLVTATIEEGMERLPDYLFCGCTSLASVSISHSVTEICYSAFRGCTSLVSIDIPDSVTEIDSYAFCGCTSLFDVILSSNIAYLGSAAFIGCDALTSISIPASLAECDCYYTGSSYGGPFAGSGLVTATIEEGMDYVPDYLFRGCTSLASVSIPSSVIGIGSYAFNGCTSLASIDIPDSVIRIYDYAFSDCVSLSDVELPSKIIYLDSCVFKGCEALASISIPASLSSCGSPFAGSGLVTATIEDGMERIINYMFDGASSLASVSIPDSVTEIGYYAFRGCTSLISIDIPDSVTYIQASAFSGCTSLTSVAIPASIAIISNAAFSGCDSLTDVYYAGSEASWNAIYIGSDNDSLANATIHYGTTIEDGGSGGGAIPSYTFSDVQDAEEWYYDAVYYLAGLGVINGYTDEAGNLTGEFGPLDGLTRAQLVTMLWRYARPEEAAAYGDDMQAAAKGATETADGVPLSGIDDGEFYTAAANWAVSEGVVTGFDMGDGTYDFKADRAATFEEVATVLARLASGGESAGYSTATLASPIYTDGSSVSDWAAPHVAWCLDGGLLSGYDNHDGTYTIKPGEDLYRARFARMLYNAIAAGAV